jgi:hypothetical protein
MIPGLSGSELGQQLREQLDSEAVAEALGHLQRCPVGLDKVLRCTVAFGVAFHHAGNSFSITECMNLLLDLVLH